MAERLPMSVVVAAIATVGWVVSVCNAHRWEQVSKRWEAMSHKWEAIAQGKKPPVVACMGADFMCSRADGHSGPHLVMTL